MIFASLKGTQAASSSQVKGILQQMSQVDKRLDGCSDYCQVGASGSLNTTPHAITGVHKQVLRP